VLASLPAGDQEAYEWVGTCSAEIVRGKVIRGVVIEVIDEPSMSQWTVCDIGNAQLLRSVDQAVCLVECLKG
jgi:hypothetical protein